MPQHVEFCALHLHLSLSCMPLSLHQPFCKPLSGLIASRCCHLSHFHCLPQHACLHALQVRARLLRNNPRLRCNTHNGYRCSLECLSMPHREHGSRTSPVAGCALAAPPQFVFLAMERMSARWERQQTCKHMIATDIAICLLQGCLRAS
jgi:hypothetical protein